MSETMTPAERRQKARAMRRRKARPSIREVAEELGVSPGTIHRDLNRKAHGRYLKKARAYKRERGL